MERQLALRVPPFVGDSGKLGDVFGSMVEMFRRTFRVTTFTSREEPSAYLCPRAARGKRAVLNSFRGLEGGLFKLLAYARRRQMRRALMARIVQKFGGTSVADIGRIKKVAQRVKQSVDAGDQVAVVVSAMAGTTNQLVNWASEITPKHDAMEYDVLFCR